MKKKVSKPKRPQDLTLRNLRANKKDMALFWSRLWEFEVHVMEMLWGLHVRVKKLEKGK